MEPDRDLPSHSFHFIKLFGRTPYCRIEPDSEDVEAAAMLKRLKALDDDRISRLPDELLVSILSLMTTKQSVKTCILSKRWQHLWKSVPVLDFIEEDNIYAENLSDIIPRVDTVLALHKSPQIVKFHLNVFYDDNDEYSSGVDHWLSYALTKNVKVLDLALPPIPYLDVPFESNLYLLPDFVYDDGSSVETMSLRCFQMLPHNKPVSWTSLKLLLLTRVQLSNLSIREIISGCPSIMTLGLCCCSGFDQMYIDSKSSLSELIIDGYIDSPALKEETPLEIRARGIRSVELLGTFGKSIRVIDLSALVDAKLEFYLKTDHENVIQVYPIILKELIQRLRHVGNLTIGTWCTQVLSVIAAKALPSLQSKYKCLTLHSCLRKLDLPGISSLLKSSVDLQTLVVDIPSNYYTQFGEAALGGEFLSSYDIEGKNYWSSMGTPVCLTMSVKTIKIIGFKGERLEIEFLQFLLENARVLQKIIIHTFKNTGYRTHTQSQASKLEGAVAQLLSFPRSSINAVILFS